MLTRLCKLSRGVEPNAPYACLLPGQRCRNRIGRAHEDGEQGISLAPRPDHHPVVLCKDAGQERIVPGHDGPHRCGVSFPQAGVLPSTSVKRKVRVPVGSGGPDHELIVASILVCVIRVQASDAVTAHALARLFNDPLRGRS